MRTNHRRANRIHRTWRRLLREGHPYSNATYVLAVESVDSLEHRLVEQVGGGQGGG
jgi:hypothetical protein